MQVLCDQYTYNSINFYSLRYRNNNKEVNIQMFKNKSKQSNEPKSLRHLKRFELFVLKNHTYFEDGSKFYWVEHAWATEEGIHVFKSR